MPETSPDFFERVWNVVRRVPPGRVTTYGHVARHLGVGRGARAVGWALKAVAQNARGGAGAPWSVPCHRVVNREGVLTGRLHFETPTVMEERLRAEGVAFDGAGRVELAAHLWDPAVEG
ncbi:MGMT family protein [Rubrivirga sp. S365]|uniref:MGMT family protein n=1 Tax=Rubrivirga litoralis TaxID=3075598 RepID=A0ABU3BU68_9BACT|nr:MULTISPECIES: MGMT family protein [unclassified Rubrivirga]MDT0632837.1 MGMT family protein [Rubrivirga sp. F394]MDT7855115.1 MGMT family protein [Rubrivirga sp. S365]